MFIYYRQDVETLLLIKGWSRWNKLLDSGLYKTTFMDLIWREGFFQRIVPSSGVWQKWISCNLV